MTKVSSLAPFFGLLTCLLIGTTAAAGVRGKDKTLRKVRQLQDCPCDCTDEMDEDVDEAFVVEGLFGTTYCVTASTFLDLLTSTPVLECAGDEDEDNCPDDFIVIPPVLGGGGDGLLDDFLQLDDALQLDDVLGFDDAFGDILPFGNAP